MKNSFKKSLVVLSIALMGFTTVNCPGKKDDNTALLLAGLFLLNQPEYTVILTGTLRGADNLPMKDGKVTIADVAGGGFLTGGQGTISDFTTCVTAGAPPANGTADGEFTLLFKTPSLSGVLDFTPNDAASATNASSCSTITGLAASDFTNVTGPTGQLAVNLDLNDRSNTSQVSLSGNTGYSITVKSISVFVKGEYTLQSPTVGENVCDGGRLTGSPVIKSGSISSSETWSGGILLQGTVFVESGATITVTPGTAVFGQRGSSIFFKRGSKLVSNGTAADPICWSSASSLGSRFPGDWGGIVTIGDSGATRASNTEGTTPQGYGGTGSLPGTSNLEMSYTIIEFGGNEVAPGDELNNLSMYASNTTLNHVQAHRGLDDQFEAWGGTGAWSNILATGGLDDDLDLDEGFGGSTLGSGATITNFISHKYIAACGGSASTDPHGLEWDGIHSDGGVACNSPSAPLLARCTTVTLNKFTLIGAGIAGGTAGRIREGAQATLTNGVAYGHASGFRVDTATAVTAATATTVRGQSGQSTTGTLNTVTYDITSLPITSDGGINTESNCGFAATKPDYTLKSGFAATGFGGAADGKWWENWAVFRAR